MDVFFRGSQQAHHASKIDCDPCEQSDFCGLKTRSFWWMRALVWIGSIFDCRGSLKTRFFWCEPWCGLAAFLIAEVLAGWGLEWFAMFWVCGSVAFFFLFRFILAFF